MSAMRQKYTPIQQVHNNTACAVLLETMSVSILLLRSEEVDDNRIVQ